MAMEGARTAPTASTECWRVNACKGSAHEGPEQTCVLVCVFKAGGRVELLSQLNICRQVKLKIGKFKAHLQHSGLVKFVTMIF